MKYVDRECQHCERMLVRARTTLIRCEYARWQVERLQECDRQIGALDVARSDYERLKARYAQARDHHRALRLRLRRQYYAHLRDDGARPNDAAGIEAKVEEFLRIAPTSQHVGALGHTLALVHEAQSSVAQQASSYCEAHNELHRVIEESKHQAQALESLALSMLVSAQRPSKRAYASLFRPDRTRPASQMTPIGQSLRAILKDEDGMI